MSGLEFLLASDGFSSSKFLASELEFLLMVTWDGGLGLSDGGLLGRGNLGESAIDLFGACNCLPTAAAVCGAQTFLKVASEDRDAGWAKS